jgi:hypothetical protein
MFAPEYDICDDIRCDGIHDEIIRDDLQGLSVPESDMDQALTVFIAKVLEATLQISKANPVDLYSLLPDTTITGLRPFAAGGRRPICKQTRSGISSTRLHSLRVCLSFWLAGWLYDVLWRLPRTPIPTLSKSSPWVSIYPCSVSEFT